MGERAGADRSEADRLATESSADAEPAQAPARQDQVCDARAGREDEQEPPGAASQRDESKEGGLYPGFCGILGFPRTGGHPSGTVVADGL